MEHTLMSTATMRSNEGTPRRARQRQSDEIHALLGIASADVGGVSVA
jgi:hypothetical protein